MGNQPAQISLLGIARTVLREELLQDIPAGKKYHALMVARAMAIAEREQRLGPMNSKSEEFSRALVAFTQDSEGPEAIARGVISKLRTRQLKADTSAISALHKLLVEEAMRKLKISNPGYLNQKSG